MAVTIQKGDCRDILPTLPAGSVNCCVTSPPYYWLRDYGVDGQIGHEANVEAFVSALGDVFAGEPLTDVTAKPEEAHPDSRCSVNLADALSVRDLLREIG